ncbi:glutathione S-transferase family protein [Chromohalobacter sarecensis]|uniref:Glutathione S-transferase family protein n=1 Tax=Chromohalobacter sarecensis TaxID=245294 RepID=A0ABV9CZT0_9GAMM|nr:glutathione S-transferase family protein [Chromohalobacter sarecensis]MCK0713604.1 glutathione S-transferase family protein [Chromohalobacter sarecensis]
MDYQLYIANKNYSSWSMRPWVLMTACDITFEEILTPFAGTAIQHAFREFSPTGKVPCLKHNDVLVWDSLAIIEYLAEAHPGVWPADKQARAWARSACAEMHSGFMALRDECSMNCGLRIELGTPSPALEKDLTRLAELWAEGLDRFGGPWLAGEAFGAVDAFYAPVAVRYRTYGLTLSAQASDYAERLLEHPAVRSWVEQGIQEPWRDEAHEQDCLRGRRILADSRQV